MKRLLHFVNEVSLGWFVTALAITILLFAFGYYLLAEAHSLVFTYETATPLTFGDAVYFSIVTISSLGYGDIRPMGWARALVGLEVLVGLAFLGLLVAKISSVKQDYILRRMYTEAVDTKLEKYTRELEEQRNLYRITSQLLLAGDIDPDLTTTFRRDTPGATFFTALRQLLSEVAELMIYEDSNGALFGHVDDSRIESVYDTVRGMLRRTVILWDKDHQAACDYVLCDNGPEMATICGLAEELAALGRKRSHNRDIIATCNSISELCERISRDILPRV